MQIEQSIPLKDQFRQLHYSMQYQALIAFGERTIIEAKATQDKQSEATAHIALFEAYYDLSEYEKAVAHIQSAIRLAEAAQDNGLLSDALAQYASYDVYIKSDHEEGYKKLTLAIIAAQTVDDLVCEAQARTLLAGVYNRQGKSNQVVGEQKRALKLAEASGDKRIIACVLNNLGTHYYATGNAFKACEYLERAIPYLLEIGDKSTFALVRVNLALSYLSRRAPHAFRKGEEIAEEALAFTRENELRASLIAALHVVGEIHKRKGDREQALLYFQEALDIAKETNSLSFTSVLLGEIGGIYVYMKQYDAAHACYLDMVNYSPDKTQAIIIANTNAAHLALLQRKPIDAWAHYRSAWKNARGQALGVKFFVGSKIVYNYFEAMPRLIFGGFRRSA